MNRWITSLLLLALVILGAYALYDRTRESPQIGQSPPPEPMASSLAVPTRPEAQATPSSLISSRAGATRPGETGSISDLGRLSELAKKSQDEAKICRSQLERARSLMSVSPMQAIQALATIPFTPRSTEEGIELIGRSAEVLGSSKIDRAFDASADLGACDLAGQLDFVRDLVTAVKSDGRPELRQALKESMAQYLSNDADRPNTLIANVVRSHILKLALDESLIPEELRSRVDEFQREVERIRSAVRLKNGDESSEDPDRLLPLYVTEIRASEPLRKSYAELASRLGAREGQRVR